MFRTLFVLVALSPSVAFACGMRKAPAVMLADAFEAIDAPEEAPAQANSTAAKTAEVVEAQPEPQTEAAANADAVAPDADEPTETRKAEPKPST